MLLRHYIVTIVAICYCCDFVNVNSLLFRETPRYPIPLISSSIPELSSYIPTSSKFDRTRSNFINRKRHQLQKYNNNNIAIGILFNIQRGGSDITTNPIGAASSATTTTSDLKKKNDNSKMQQLSVPLSVLSFIVPIVSVLSNYVTTTLRQGPYGVIGLTIIGAIVNIPLTQYKNLYGISVGYGLTVASIAYVLRSVMMTTTTIVPYSINDILSNAAIFYGMRLALFLFVRDVSGAKPLSSDSSTTTTTSSSSSSLMLSALIKRLQRIPFAVSLSLFYAFMMTPLLYAMQNPVVVGTWQIYIATIGCSMAWFGAIVEAIADIQKFIVKGRSNGKAFHGPISGLYRITRHPNYTGEVLFWVGLYVAGLPSFGSSIIAYICSTLGLYGIVSIMRGATKSLEKKQSEKYTGQPKYDQWKKDVPIALLPLL